MFSCFVNKPFAFCGKCQRSIASNVLATMGARALGIGLGGENVSLFLGFHRLGGESYKVM